MKCFKRSRPIIHVIKVPNSEKTLVMMDNKLICISMCVLLYSVFFWTVNVFFADYAVIQSSCIEKGLVVSNLWFQNNNWKSLWFVPVWIHKAIISDPKKQIKYLPGLFIFPLAANRKVSVILLWLSEGCAWENKILMRHQYYKIVFIF